MVVLVVEVNDGVLAGGWGSWDILSGVCMVRGRGERLVVGEYIGVVVEGGDPRPRGGL